MSKLDSLQQGSWRAWSYPDTFARQQTTGPERLVVGAGTGHAMLVLALASVLGPPFKVLYVLHTPRGGSMPGRYESPVLDGPEVVASSETSERSGLRMRGTMSPADEQ